MTIKRKDFQKAAAFIHEFLLKLSEDVECAEVRDTLNLALLHMQKYYRLIQNRSQEKNGNTLSLTARGLSPMTPFVDAPDKFIWRWVSLDNTRNYTNVSLGDSLNFAVLPPLISAAKDGDVDQLSEILSEDPTCTDCIDGLGRTAAMYAVHYFQHEALKFLLDQRADVNAQAHDESTAMHRACHDANHIALKLLVDYGGDFTICDVQGRAPIHWAVTTHSTECLQILLAQGVSGCTRDKDMLTPSMWACRMDNIKHFELLCHAENKVEEHDGIERDASGRTWMHWSVRRTQPLECLQTLLTPDSAAIKDKEGKTVLHLASEMGSLHACRVVLEIAGEGFVHDQDNQGRTALHVATMGGHGDVVNFLLDKNADVNVVDNYNATAWDYARIRKLHYCQLIIMSHQRQRMSNNPMSPLPNGLGLLMRTDSSTHDDFNKMGFKTRSSQSTPVTSPYPPKRPRSSRLLVHRANSLTSADREPAMRRENRKMNILNEKDSNNAHGELRERILGNTNKSMSAEDLFFNAREETMMTYSSRPVFEDENDELSVEGMDVSDIEDEDRGSRISAASSHGPSRRPRPLPRRRPEYLSAPSPPSYMQNRGSSIEKKNAFGFLNTNNAQQQSKKVQQQQQQKSAQIMEFEDVAVSSPPQSLDQQGRPGSQHVRPQARVPPTPIYRPSRGVSVPTPPSTTPQRPHMIRQQQPLPPSISHGPKPSQPPLQQQHQQQQQQQSRERLSPTSRDVKSPLSSQSSEPQQHSSRSDRPGSGDNQPPGILEGFRIPPPALTPLQNAPKPPDLDMFDRKEKKKRRKEKREAKQQTQKPENPSDITPPRGFAAPLHPHGQGQSGQGININPPALPMPKFAKTGPQYSGSRYVDENVEDDETPPFVSGVAILAQDGGDAKMAKPKQGNKKDDEQVNRNENSSSMTETNKLEEEEMFQGSVDGSHSRDLEEFIPPPPSFRGVPRAGTDRPLSQSLQENSLSSRMIPTSAKPPLPKNRNSVTPSSSQQDIRHTRSAYLGRKSKSPTRKSTPAL